MTGTAAGGRPQQKAASGRVPEPITPEGSSPQSLADTASPTSVGTPATSLLSNKEKAAAKVTKDSAVVLQLTKTKMCAFFERGKCASSKCRYAHSADELRTPPNLQKTKLCRAFMQGNCNSGENCVFAHGEGDLRVTEGIYKTQICNFYERGYCKKGDRCNHAHGSTDLRPPAAKKVIFGASTPLAARSDAPPPQRRSPLPLAELLVADTTASSEAVHDLAALAFSPMPSSPAALWGHPSYDFQASAVSPVIGMGAPAAAGDALLPPLGPWPRDPLDVLMDHYAATPTPPHATGPAAYPAAPALPIQSRVAASPLPSGATPRDVPPPPPLSPQVPVKPKAAATKADSEETLKLKDAVVLDLSERLASLDSVVKGLAADVAGLCGSGETVEKQLCHKI
mmetsp:Transcript_114733/g.244805  ORF Transcript_114733/g.244805 Transcript_114733/m.244805 type:complete len:397 (+) Transcript_114733:67-1257(+)